MARAHFFEREQCYVKRTVKRAVIVFAVLGLGALGVFAAERRRDRASNTLRRELLDLGPTPSPRPLHVALDKAVDAGTGGLLATHFGLDELTLDDARVSAFLEATRAARGGLPLGLEVGTAGADSWRGVALTVEALTARFQSGATAATVDACLDAFALGRDLARGGGTRGVAAARALTEGVFAPCGVALTTVASDSQRVALRDSLEAIIEGAPTLARAFREADLDVQVHTFGRWMRPQDLAELSPGIRQAAHEAFDLPTGFVDRQKLLGLWSRMSKTTHAAMDALDLVDAARDEKLAALESQLDSKEVDVRPRWREAIQNHERRLALLRMLQVAVRLTASTPRVLSEVERGDLTLDGGVLALRGTALSLTLPPVP